MSNQNVAVTVVDDNYEDEFDFLMWAHDRVVEKTEDSASMKSVTTEKSVDTTDAEIAVDNIDAEIAALINKPTPTELLMRNIVDWASEVGIIPNWVAAIIPDDVYLSIGNTIDKLILEKVGELGQLPITPEILLAILGELKDTDKLSSVLKNGFDMGFNFDESLSRKMATSNTNAAEDIAEEAIAEAISEPQPAGVKIVTISAKGKNKRKQR